MLSPVRRWSARRDSNTGTEFGFDMVGTALDTQE
jgi:hypothetical protein